MKNDIKREDLIRRSDAVDMFQRLSYADWNQGAETTWANAFSECEELINLLPAVDAVEVCRCRECKFFDKGQNDAESWEWCNIWERDCESECYCRYGQRREDGDE